MAILISKATLAARFNSIVLGQLKTPAAGGATWFQGNVLGINTIPPVPLAVAQAGIGSHPQLGLRAEPPKTAADITVSELTVSNIYNFLHGLAMELTRVRKAQYVFYYSNPATATLKSAVMGTETTALKPSLALYFKIPGGQPPSSASPMSLADLDIFLDDLYEAVQDIRTNEIYLHTFTATAACHGSCHSACHGSRGRR